MCGWILFVPCAAKITAMDGLSFQGLIFLMFLSCLTVRPICLFICFWNCQFQMVKKKSNINFKLCGIDGLHIV